MFDSPHVRRSVPCVSAFGRARNHGYLYSIRYHGYIGVRPRYFFLTAGVCLVRAFGA